MPVEAPRQEGLFKHLVRSSTCFLSGFIEFVEFVFWIGGLTGFQAHGSIESIESEGYWISTSRELAIRKYEALGCRSCYSIAIELLGDPLGLAHALLLLQESL